MQNTLPSLPNHPLYAEDQCWLEKGVKEARRELARVLKIGSPAEKAQALSHLAGFVSDLEGPAPALRLSRRAHRLWKVVGDPALVAISGSVLAVRLLDAGQPKEALRQSGEALLAMRQLKPLQRHKGVPNALGREFLSAGYAAEAQTWLELALENPEEGQRANILAQVSRALDLQGKLPEARDRQFEACAAFHFQKEFVAMAKGMLRLARLEIRLGRRWEAMTLCKEAASILERRRCKAEAVEARELYRCVRPKFLA
jgi:tetratricopeptide (TPR) repeat protein